MFVIFEGERRTRWY